MENHIEKNMDNSMETMSKWRLYRDVRNLDKDTVVWTHSIYT